MIRQNLLIMETFLKFNLECMNQIKKVLSIIETEAVNYLINFSNLNLKKVVIYTTLHANIPNNTLIENIFFNKKKKIINLEVTKNL